MFYLLQYVVLILIIIFNKYYEPNELFSPKDDPQL